MLRRRRFQPQHQGAGRLLGRPVHRRRRAAGPGRAHPRPPRLDAGVGARPPSTAVPRPGGPGDQVVLNDPFAGGTHLNDVTVVAPCLVDGRLVGWVANRAHHADVGGMAPGSHARRTRPRSSRRACGCRPCGLTPRWPPVVAANSRTPEERSGDLDAQVGANRVGVERLAAPGRRSPFDEVARLRRAAHAGRAGRAARRVVGRSPTCSTAPATAGAAAAAVVAGADQVGGDGITFDFTGTEPQRRGNVNAVEAVTVSAVAWAVRSVTDPTIPANGGALRPVPGRSPRRHASSPPCRRPRSAPATWRSASASPTCASAPWPRPCPGRVGAAGQGTMNNVMLGGDGWVYYETIGGGQGGRPPGPGGADCRCRDSGDPHRHDQHPQHPDRGAGAGLPDAGACGYGCGGAAAAPGSLRAATASSGTSRCWRLHLSSSPSGGYRSRGAWPAARPGRWGRTGWCPQDDERRAERLPPTSAPSTWRPATWSGS